MLEHVEAGEAAQDLKMDVLRAIRYIIYAWDEITGDTIRNCWHHTKILPAIANADLRNLAENVRQTTDPELDDLAKALDALQLPDPMPLDEFLNPPDENIVNEVLDDEHIISGLIDIFMEEPDPQNASADDIDDSVEVPAVTISAAASSLEIVSSFLLQHGSDLLKLSGAIGRFITEKRLGSLRQTTLDQYFTSE